MAINATQVAFKLGVQTFGKTLAANAKEINLNGVKTIKFKFNPFYQNAASIRCANNFYLSGLTESPCP